MSLSLRKHKSHHYSRPRPRLRSGVITQHGLGLNLFSRKLLDNLSHEGGIHRYAIRDAKDEIPGIMKVVVDSSIRQIRHEFEHSMKNLMN